MKLEQVKVNWTTLTDLAQVTGINQDLVFRIEISKEEITVGLNNGSTSSHQYNASLNGFHP